MIRGAAMRARWGLGVAFGLVTMSWVVAARAEVANRIVATIDGEPITAHELQRYAKDRDPGGAEGRQILEALITDKLLEREIKALGIVARDDEIDRYIREVQARTGMDDERFKQAIATQGMTWEGYRAKVKMEIEKAQLVNREIRQHVNISPEEIKRYYDKHLADYAIAERIRVRDIFLPADSSDEEALARARGKAEEVRALALAGRDFAGLARQFSEGPGADKGGELGTFSRGEMEGDLEEALFKLKPGDVSPPIRSGSGFHLLRVDERITSGHKPLEEVKEDIRDALYNEALESRFQQWLSRDLRERHHVEVLD
jgi:peptidyl-prolyl cis-trans isomerase SurA